MSRQNTLVRTRPRRPASFALSKALGRDAVVERFGLAWVSCEVASWSRISLIWIVVTCLASGPLSRLGISDSPGQPECLRRLLLVAKTGMAP